ncbi:MAG: toxin [Anaerolineales bacterium]|nr:MAG: toxin [Anaerolineales bacterium]
MKYFSWNEEKNELLREERQLSFEDVVFYIEQGFLLDVLEHPNQEKYKGQKIFVLQMDDYVYLVPFIEDDREIFLKTIIPSRIAMKKYLKGSDE